MNLIPYIITHEGCTVVIHGKPYHVAAEDKYYTRVVTALNGGQGDEEEVLWEFERVGKELKSYVETVPGMEYASGQVNFEGQPMRQYAVNKLVSFIKEELPPESLTVFLGKLANNPNYQTREDLYAFLEHGRMPITTRGNFLAYKAVRSDWKDIHSGTYSNHIGAVLEMPRAKVDDRREHTCSSGFHVCSYDYLPSFSHADGHVVICEIDPADVVSIPTDYDNTKMRVCKYTVIGEVEGYYNQVKKEDGDILAKEEVFNDEDYAVWALDSVEGWTWISDAGSADEAKDIIAHAKSDEDEDDVSDYIQYKVTTGMDIVIYREAA